MPDSVCFIRVAANPDSKKTKMREDTQCCGNFDSGPEERKIGNFQLFRDK